MEAGNAPWLSECALSTSAASCSKPHQLPGSPPWGLYCPRGRSAQDMRPRTLRISRQLPGVESSGHRAKLHRDPSDSTYLSVPLHVPQGLGSLFVSRAPALPIHGVLVPKRFQNLFCSDPD